MYDKILTIAFVLTIIVTFLMYANVAKARTVEDGLVSYWTCDQADIDGDTLRDAWGENHGKIFGGPKVVAGKVKEALEFGENKYVEMPSHESFDFGDGPFTLSAWINIEAYSGAGEWSRIVGRHTQSPPRYGLSIHNKVLFQVNGTFLEGSTGIETGQWYHLVGMRDEDANGKIYVNGNLDKTGAVDAASTDGGGNVHCGTKGNKSMDWFRGIIDEVSIYNRALSDAEVMQNFEAKGLDLAVNSVGKLTSTWGKIKVSK